MKVIRNMSTVGNALQLICKPEKDDDLYITTDHENFPLKNFSIIISNENQIAAAARICEILQNGTEITINGSFNANNDKDKVEFFQVKTINGQTINSNPQDKEILIKIFISKYNAKAIWQDIDEIKSYETKQKHLDFPEHKQLITEVDNILERIINLPVFKNIAVKEQDWRLTQIFSNDTTYHNAYKLIQSLDKMCSLSFKFDNDKIVIEQFDKLYEYWILFKILEVLIVRQGWQPVKDNQQTLITQTVKDILQNKSKQFMGLTINLKHKLPDTEFLYVACFRQYGFYPGARSKKQDFYCSSVECSRSLLSYFQEMN